MFFLIISVLILALILGPVRHYYKIPDVCSIRDLLKKSSISYLEISSQFFFSQKTVSFHNHLESAVPMEVAPKMLTKRLICEIRSEMVGTFTWASAEDGKPTICLGRAVKKDEVVGFITTLRLPTPILSPTDGKIVGLPIKDNCPVQYGELLMLIEKNGNSLV